MKDDHSFFINTAIHRGVRKSEGNDILGPPTRRTKKRAERATAYSLGLNPGIRCKRPDAKVLTEPAEPGDSDNDQAAFAKKPNHCRLSPGSAGSVNPFASDPGVYAPGFMLSRASSYACR